MLDVVKRACDAVGGVDALAASGRAPNGTADRAMKVPAADSGIRVPPNGDDCLNVVGTLHPVACCVSLVTPARAVDVARRFFHRALRERRVSAQAGMSMAEHGTQRRRR
jgi:hypothetical protein